MLAGLSGHRGRRPRNNIPQEFHTMSNKTPWTDHENSGLIALYFVMLDHAIPGQQYTKAGLIRCARLTPREVAEQRGYQPSFIGTLANRSRGSIEFKLMNASAAHADLDGAATTMHSFGYRAMPNYQASLKDALREELRNRAGAALLPASHPHYKGAA
jgi:hypothetical protein